MNNELTCNQVIALINFYLDNKLNPRLKLHIENHLQLCPKCKDFYAKYIERNRQKTKTPSENFEDKQYQNFKNNLSAYIDNELDAKENLRIKKMVITNPTAREEMERIYKLKKMMHNSYEKIKNDMKQDYTRTIMNKLLIVETKTEPFYKIAAIFSGMITLIVIGFIVVLNL